jgi:hypothetical protein
MQAPPVFCAAIHSRLWTALWNGGGWKGQSNVAPWLLAFCPEKSQYRLRVLIVTATPVRD